MRERVQIGFVHFRTIFQDPFNK